MIYEFHSLIFGVTSSFNQAGPAPTNGQRVHG